MEYSHSLSPYGQWLLVGLKSMEAGENLENPERNPGRHGEILQTKS